MSNEQPVLCDDQLMTEILELSSGDTEAGVAAIDAALADYPDDARLHFLKGSMLIGEKRFIGAHGALRRAVELAPEFHLARFQLGLFELTSGEAEAALATWQPLETLPDDNFLMRFVEGLKHLIADRFDACIEALSDGILRNHENEPLNNDMRMIIERCEELASGTASSAPKHDEAVSATSLLLGSARRPRQ